MFHKNLYIQHMAKWTQRTALLCTAIMTAWASVAQSPTHIDQGTNDDEVHISDDLGYIFLIVGFLVLLVVWFLVLRKRTKNRKGNRD